MTRQARRWIGMLSLALSMGVPLHASGVRFLELAAREELAAGNLDGVAVGPLGTLSLADRSERLTGIDVPFLLSVARHPEGWVLGTGNEGKVLLVDREGRVRELFDAAEPEVFAVWVDEDGTVFAATSPRGKVYRIAGGEVEEYFDPGETYVWALTQAADGALLVATGTEGRLYRVTGRGEGEVVFDSDDPHLRSLLALEDGRVLLGTAGEGQIVELADGRARTLYDAQQPEVVALAAAADGVVYAAAIASEASVVDAARAAGNLPQGRRPQTQREPQEQPEEPGEEGDEDEQEQEEAAGQVTVVVSAGGDAAAAAASAQGPRSVILRLERNGFAREVQTLDEQTVYALLWARDRLWIGTGLEGQLFSLQDDHLVLEKDVDERQVVALVADDPGPAFATTNAAALYRVTGVSERQGEYTSAALDARQASRFGELRWEGELPAGSSLAFSARSGMSSEPDATWSAWSAPQEGNGLSLSAIPPGRYVQWRARFRAADGRSPEIRRVTVSYRHENLPPRIAELEVLEAGVALLYPGGAGREDVFEAWRPERDGIFSSLRAASDDDHPRRARRPGFRSLVWEAEDPNEDDLRFRLSFRSEEGGSDWLMMAEGLEDPWFSFDSTALPDGWYRVRLQARDRPFDDEGGDPGLEAERISVPILIDNSAPRQAEVEVEGGFVVVKVEDAWSPLRAARYSLDARRWEPAGATDGLVDGLAETLRVPMPDSGTLLLLQVEDAARNVTTFDLSRWLP